MEKTHTRGIQRRVVSRAHPRTESPSKKGEGSQGEIKKMKKDQKKEALKEMGKEAFGLLLTTEILEMEEFLLCGDCSPPASKKTASGEGRSGNF